MVEEQLIRLITSRFALFYFWSGVKSFPWRCSIFHFDIFYRRVSFFFYFQGDVMEERGVGLAIFLDYLFIYKVSKKEFRKRKGWWKLCCVRFIIHSSFFGKLQCVCPHFFAL